MDVDADMTDALLELLESLGFGVFTADGYRLLDVNTAMVRLFGRRREELLGIEPSQLLAPSDRVIMAERAEDRSGRVALRRASILRPDDDSVPVTIVSRAVREGLRLGVIVDESELVTAEVELELFKTLGDHAPVGVLIWDGRNARRGVDMRLHWVSQPVLNLLGVERADALGARFGDLLPFIDPELAERALGLAGTDRVERVPELSSSTPGNASGRILERLLIGLPNRLVAVRVADVTNERKEEERCFALLRRVVEIGDSERQRLAMDLHDDAIQRGAAAALLLEGLVRRPDHPERAVRLATATSSIRELVTTLRHLIFELSPPELIESGIEAALANALDYLFADTDVHTDLDVSHASGVSLPKTIETTAFRIAVEALTNARKHADASTVLVRIAVDPDAIDLTIRDDGLGLGSDGFHHDPAHFGLRSMSERAAGAGGACTIVDAPTGGVEVHARLPLVEGRPSPPLATFDLPDPGAVASLRASFDDATAAVVATQHRAERTQARLDDLIRLGRTLQVPGMLPDQIAQTAAELIAEATRGEAVIHLPDGDDELRMSACTATDEPASAWVERHVVRSGQLRAAVRSGVAIQIDRIATAEAEERLEAIVVAMTAMNEAMGTLTVVFREGDNDWSDEFVEFVGGLAAQVAAALALARDRGFSGRDD